MKSKGLKKHTFINREISWLHFNERVLQEAADNTTPLIERIRFLGIFSNNQDEFFRVRVATLKRLAKLEKRKLENLNIEPDEILKQVNSIVKLQQKRFLSVFRRIVQDLQSNGIIILNDKSISHETHISFIKDYYINQVRSQIFPIILSAYDETSVLRDENLYLAVHLKKKSVFPKEDFALIEVPTQDLTRIIVLPEIQDNKSYIILLEDIVRFFLPNIFSMLDYDSFSAYAVKLTRDAELDIDNDISKSFLERIEESLKQRDTGNPVRFVYDKTIPDRLLQIIQSKLSITKDDTTIAGGRYHNFKDFMSFPPLKTTSLVYEPLPPLPHPHLTNAKRIIDVLDNNDVMLTFPYHSFHYIIDFLREASIHPEVRSIRMTVYRIAPNSKVMNALINASRNGKSVTVFMELQARFDEKLNIYWSERLREEGVRIIHSIPGLKVHCKLIQIRRSINKKDKYYSLIGTGNFNESTAKIYSDNILMTSNQKIGDEVRQVFQLFDTVYRPYKFQKLVISPFDTRKFINSKINKLIKYSSLGLKATCIIKLNSLTDNQIAQKLVKASEAGADINLIIRGMCVIAPNISDLRNNIFAISIVDRFLEHSRILYFNFDGVEEFYISSADWMPRNLDNRIEVTCPIYDQSIREEIYKQLNTQLNDNIKARYHDNKGSVSYIHNQNPPVRSQYVYYDNCLSQL
jgi:polyphosphate kinase